MVENERFSLLKFAGSFFQFLPWVKTLRYAAGIALIGLVGLTIYRAFFMPTNKQITQIVAQPGSQVTVVEEKKKEAKKLFRPQPFIEGYGFVESDGRNGLGGRLGIRIEF
ncbi:MAG: hypothetical protein C4533_07950 [Candidatus Omnitrophota bacterium]|jgi:hypothetical protein|nr:MAG: hypothetical protein C4533_07950 [Candidatus Omnitrophota bacterium]